MIMQLLKHCACVCACLDFPSPPSLSMATQPEPKPDDLPLRQHGRMADIMTTILTTGDVNAKVGRKLPRTAV